MTTKELIKAEIDNLNEEDLDELYNFVQTLAQSKTRTGKQGLLTKLQEIRIDAPADFAANLDLYLSGEKSVEYDIYSHCLRGCAHQPSRSISRTGS